MVFVSFIASSVGESFSIQPIFRQPSGTKGTGHLLLTLGHHKKQGVAQRLLPCHLNHTPRREKKKKKKKKRPGGGEEELIPSPERERERYS